MRQTSGDEGKRVASGHKRHMYLSDPLSLKHTLFWLPVFDALFLLLKYLPSGKLTILEGCCLGFFYLNFSPVLTFIFQPFHASVCYPFFFSLSFHACILWEQQVLFFCFPSFYFSVSASHFPHTLNFYWLCSFFYPHFHHPKAFPPPPYYHSAAKQNSSFQTKLVNTPNNTGERNLC